MAITWPTAHIFVYFNRTNFTQEYEMARYMHIFICFMCPSFIVKSGQVFLPAILVLIQDHLSHSISGHTVFC